MKQATLPVESALMDFRAVSAVIGRRADQATRLFLWRAARDGSFPSPVRLGKARIMWRRGDIEAAIAALTPVAYGRAEAGK